VWIRTCYATDLQAAYDEIIEAGLREDENPDGLLVLDNEDLYGSYEEDWTKVFLRLPMLPDAVYYSEDDPKKDEPTDTRDPPSDEAYLPLRNASTQDKQVVYVVDEQALRTNLVKLIYLDTHGNAVWHNTILPERITYFEANYFKGSMLGRLEEMCGLGDESLLQPGAQIWNDYWI
jgi:hypothetical protein